MGGKPWNWADCIIDGVPPEIKLNDRYIQNFLDKRKLVSPNLLPKKKKMTKLKSFRCIRGKTTGTPISLLIKNKDVKSKDYSEIKDKFRPGHADFTYQMKYGIRDYGGGGKLQQEKQLLSCSWCCNRKILGNKTKIRGALIQIGKKKINRNNWDYRTDRKK